jgi:type I restriction enzyme, S subunit
MDNNLPKGWIECKLGDVFKTSSGGTPSRTNKNYYNGNIPWVKSGELNYNLITNTEEKISEEAVKNSSAKIFPKGTLLIALYGATIGKLAFLDIDATTNQAVCGIFEDGNSNLKYLYWFLYFKRPELIEAGIGGAQPNISQTLLKDLSFPLSPLPEQQRIVEKLDALMARISNSKTRLEKIPALLKNFRQSVLAAAVSGELTKEWREGNENVGNAEVLLKSKKQEFEINSEFKEINDIPESWKWIALGNYAKCSRGRFSIRPRNDPRYFNGKYPFIQIGDLPREGGFIKIHTQTLNEEGFKVSKMFSKNTVAIAIVGATIGNTGILAYDMCFTDSIVGIETGVDYSNFYVDYYLRSEKENFRQISYAGGGQPNIKLETINTYPFPLPPLEEQKEIVRKVKELFHFADSIEARYQKAKAWFDKLPQAILAKAFRGELVPQNENDESASVLLERIKNSKTKSEKSKPSSKAKQRKMYEGDDQLSLVAEE